MQKRLNGYLLDDTFQNKNAGFSKWTTGTKDGKDYFLKEFIDPIYPMGDSISEKMKAIRIAECEKAEAKIIRLYQTVNRVTDGNLVRIEEFFRSGSHYYMVMQKVDEAGVSLEELQGYAFQRRVLLCRIVAHAIMSLHEGGIIHSDIKDTNVLLHRSPKGRLTAKIIDFDCGFFEGEAPESGEELGGDQVYLSPEGCLFLCEEEAELTCKMDVFSMGILFHQYLTGKLPGFDTDEYDYAHEAVLDGQELVIDDTLPYDLRQLLAHMLCLDVAERWSSKKVDAALGKYLFGEVSEEEMADVAAGAKPVGYRLGSAGSESTMDRPLAQPDPAASQGKWFHSAGDLGGKRRL